jgi:hypothetical protein
MRRRTLLFAAWVSTFLGALTPHAAQAVPSYARQTGLPCSGCHYTPPELNPAGRRFKLLGYTDRKEGLEAVKGNPSERQAALDILAALPVSAWFETSFTSTSKPQQGTQNGNFEFPQDVSLFLAGAWASHVGSFLQITYSTTDDHFTMDNTDVRVANMTKSNDREFAYGLTLNNNPTVEDLWNTTPAWGFPFIASDVAPAPTAAPLIQGGLAQDVAGIGGYAMWNDHLYLATTLYRTAHVGGPQPNPGTDFGINIRGVAPYWRVAWQQSGEDTQFEIGSYGLYVESTPNGVIGLKDKYTDWAFDLQLDHTLFRTDVLSLRINYIHESSNLEATFDAGGAQQTSHHLGAAMANAEYHFGNRFSGIIGWFNTTGTTDPLLYPQSPISGSATGNPASSGLIGSVSWWPIQNLQVALQYIGYSRFNGSTSNYDAAGRSASDNNTTYVLGRFVF